MKHKRIKKKIKYPRICRNCKHQFECKDCSLSGDKGCDRFEFVYYLKCF